MHEKVSYLATHLAQSHLGEPVTLYVHASQMVVELKAMRGTRELEAEDFYQGLHPWLDNNRGTIHHIRLNVPKPLRHTTDRCIADFTNNRTPGLNEETLLVVAASLQGAKPSVQEYAVSRSGLKPEQFPIRFDEQLYRSLQAWMTRAGVEAGKVSTWTPEKIRFYTVLRDLLVITSQDVSQTLPYLLSEFHAEDRGVGTLRAFFPHLAELLGQEIEYKRRGNKVPLHRLLLELSKREVDLSRLIKETVKILHNSGRAKDLHRGGLSEELAILSSPSGKSIPTVLYEVRRDFQDDPREREYRTQARERLKQEKHPPEPINGEEVGKKWPKLEDYGLRVDHSRTRMMQKFEGMEEAIVADIRSIREHPEKYLQYQRDLVLAIAQRLQRSGQIDLRASIPSPHFSGATAELKQREEITFRAHEKLLKESSDWLWLLLYPQVQKIFLQYLPFISTPPHVTIDSQAVPVWKKEEQPRIKQAIEGGAELVNELPFLNYAFKMAEMPHEKFTYGGWRQMLTVVGDFIKLALEDGALVYLDHGTARRVASGFDPMTTSQADGFVAITQEQIYKTKPPFDVDMIVLTKEKSLGTLAKTVAEKWNSLYDSRLSYSELMGHTLQNIIFAYIAKHIGRINPDGTESKHADNTIIQNPARVLGHPSCLVNVLRGWQGRETAGKPDLLIESLLALSRFRSFGLVPFLVKLPGDNYQAMAGKLVDILGGIP
ncbi:hypothetical protein HY357_03995, partial [Candidatus Roizmanbacteria bacterium]|nr:hypothetical protein [Candidatus Roizmanbacteria bacterium]